MLYVYGFTTQAGASGNYLTKKTISEYQDNITNEEFQVIAEDELRPDVSLNESDFISNSIQYLCGARWPPRSVRFGVRSWKLSNVGQ
jgi:hypothetical protein